MARIGYFLMLTLIFAGLANAAPESQVDEPRGGAPAYVGLELGAAFPLAFGRYVLFGLEEQPGTFGVFRVGELDGTTTMSYEVLFDDALQSGTLKVSGTSGSSQAMFAPPDMNARDFAQGELNLLAATEPAMLIEPLSVDYTFLSRDYVSGISGVPVRIARSAPSKITLFFIVCDYIHRILCEASDNCPANGLNEKFLLPNGDLISSRFHNDIVLRSESGQYYNGRYQQFGAEFLEGVFATPIFIYDINAAITAWSPAFVSALDSDGSYLVDQRMEDTITTVVQGYLDSAGPAFRQMIEQESVRMGLDNLAGLTINEIIQRVEASYSDSLFEDTFEGP